MAFKILNSNIIDDSRNIINAASVGIGTINPTSKLWVDGDGYFTGVTTASRFVSNVAQGTAPISVASSTLVTNLNANFLNGFSDAYYLEANNLTGTAPGSVISQSNGLTVTGNLSVSGNVSVSGTSFLLNAATLQVKDRDIVLGITTNANGDDISNDSTATHGGISIASTVGTPIFDMPQLAGINSSPSTYKQFMWISSATGSSFSGVATDAWISNYAIGIGTLTVRNGSRLTVGAGFTVYDTYLDAQDIRARNINATGIHTAATYYVGATKVLDTVNSQVSLVGIATIDSTTRTTLERELAFAPNDFDSLKVSGISTLQSTTLIGGGTSTGTAGQVLQVTGISSGAYIGGNLGIGTTNPIQKLWVEGNGYFSGVVTATNFYVGTQLVGGSISGTDLVGTALSVSGISTLGTVEISSGIITATTGVVTYYGDGSKLTGTVSISTNTTNQAQYLTYVTGTGSTNGFGVTTTGLVFNPFNTRLGIGTNTLTTTLNIGGALGFTNNNIRIGDTNTGCSITSGTHNFFAGSQAGSYNTSASNNNFLGVCAGRANTTGCYNNFFGACTGRANTTGRYNNFFGARAGLANTTGGYNNFFGQDTGRINTTGCFNNFLGSDAGRSNISGSYNNFFGRGAGFYNSSGCKNNFIGDNAGRYNTSGRYNNFFGNRAGYYNITGEFNNFLGNNAGFANTTGSHNNFFGSCAGCTQTDGSRNIALGYNVQLPDITGSDQLVIGSGSDFWISGNSSYNVGLGTTNPTEKLDVNGSVRFRSSITDNNNATGTSNQVLTATSAGAGVSWASLTAASVGAISGVTVTPDTATTTPLFPIFTSSTGTSITGVNVDTSGLTFIPTGSGSLGIGTTSPTKNLDVNGDARIRGGIYDVNNTVGAANSVLTANGTGGWSWQPIVSGGGGAISGINVTQDDTGVRYPLLAASANSATTTQYIDDNGLVYNTTTNCLGIGSLTPTSKLDIIGDVKVVGIVTASDFNSSSDIKLKTNIKTITNPIEKVLQISGVNFNWKESGKATMGVIAQEVEKVLPELVSDADPKSVNYNGLIGLLIECIKDQQRQIDELKTK